MPTDDAKEAGTPGVNRRARLEESELFGMLPPDALARLRTHLHLRPYKSREYLYFEGQPAEHLWILRSGQVRTIKAGRGGRVMTLEHLQPGRLFGVSAVLDATVYTETAEALTEGEAWRVSRRFVSKLLTEEPGLVHGLLSIVAGRLEEAHDRLCSFAHDSVPARIARLILSAPVTDDRIEMTRRALGDEAGTTVETTIRVLRGFERSGWIKGGIGWIRVVDRPALEHISRGDKPEEEAPGESPAS